MLSRVIGKNIGGIFKHTVYSFVAVIVVTNDLVPDGCLGKAKRKR